MTSRGPPSLRGAVTIALSSVALLFAFVLPGSSQAATAIGLGTADSYGVLGGAGVTNTGPTVINGDLGTHPTPAVTGFDPVPGDGTVNGTIHRADAAALGAKDDLTTAYNNAAAQGPSTQIPVDLAGQTLTPGVYTSITGEFSNSGALTLDGQGDPDAVFIFKSASTLVTATGSSVNLINSVQSCRIYWQVSSSATLGGASSFVGNILAQDSISLGNAVTVDGRLLARSASVTLINDTVTRADCAPGTTAPPVTPPTTPTTPPTTPTSPTTPTVVKPPNFHKPPGQGGTGGGNNPTPTAFPPPKIKISETPGGGWHRTSGPRCADHGFRAQFRIHSDTRMRSVEVYLDGMLIRRTTQKNFSVWVKVRGLRFGRSTVRVVAIDVDGERSTRSKSFRYCEAAAPEPNFTGRALATP